MNAIRYRGSRLLFALGLALTPLVAQADYVATAINRVFIDPASLPVVIDGYQGGDEVAFIFETTPEITNGATSGVGAWSTVYLPRGARVIAAELVVDSGGGVYTAIPARDLATMSSAEPGGVGGVYGCGNRGCDGGGGMDDSSGVTRSVDGGLALNQHDTGVFYSTDPQTAQIIGTPLSRDPTGSPVTNVYNQWDANQIDAFGIGAALSNNGGNGTTPIVSYNSGSTYVGTGSPVAGPHTYFTHDYDPTGCRVADNAANPFTPPGDATVFQGRLGCVGPWQRIVYPNSKTALAVAVPVVPAVASTGSAPTNRVNHTAVTASGTVVSSAQPLTTSANAIRFVAGVRNVGDLELTRVTLRITNTPTDIANFVADITGGARFCLDATGGDNNTNARGGQDNIWRYYEGNNHACYDGDPGILLKQAKFVNNVPSSGGSLRPGDVIAYEISFSNTTAATITNVQLSDLITTPSPLRLVAPGTAGCPYASYNGSPGGIPAFNLGSLSPGPAPNYTTANWATFNSAAGSTVTVYACAQVQASAAVGDQAVNEARAVYASITSSSTSRGTVSGLDFGDAPSSYGTTASGNGARHATTFSTTMKLGAVGPDSEGEGPLSGNSTNDDLVSDDEDGIVAALPVLDAANVGSNYGFTVNATNNLAANAAVAGICSYLDLNANGVFESAELVFTSVPDNTVNANLAQTIALTNQTIPEGLTYLRTRISTDFSTAALCNPTGPAANGEVEDYAVTVQSRDFGDLPDAAAGVGPSASGNPPNYRTTLADGGPRHTVSAGLRLGSVNDADLNGINSLGVADDSTDGLDDEEGLESISRIAGSPSQNPITANVRVTNTTGSPARICLFVDRNADGTFDDQAEIATAAVPSGTNGALVQVVLPASGVINQPALTPGIGIRVRLAPESVLGASCEAAEADGQLTGSGAPALGEVEDYYTGSPGTVPVTLSMVDVQVRGSELTVNFHSASEAGTLGYRVLADVGRGTQARVEIGTVGSSTIDSFKEQAYVVRAPNPGAEQIWIEEFSVDGKAQLYGPYQVNKLIGEVGLTQSINWAQAKAEQQAFRASQLSAWRGMNSGAAELRVERAGWVRVSAAQLMSEGVDFSGLTAAQIRVQRGTQTIPTLIDMPGATFDDHSSISFYADLPSNTFYSKIAVYRIAAGPGTALTVSDEVVAASGASSVRSERKLSENRIYSLSSPSDPWFMFRALRSGASTGGEYAFTLDDRMDADGERIQVEYWGGLNYAGNALDHHVVFVLNGVTIGEDRFDGLTSRSFNVDLPANVLHSGINTLRLSLPADTGFASDIVNVEGITLGYTRRLTAVNNALNVSLRGLGASGAIFSDGFDETPAQLNESESLYLIEGISAPVVVIHESTAGRRVVARGAGETIKLQIAASIGDRLVVEPQAGSAFALNASPEIIDSISGFHDYLVISHPSFIAGLSDFVAAKENQGFTVKLVDVESLYRAYGQGEVEPAAINSAIAKSASLGATHVLLVGGDTYDYHDTLGVNSISYVPTHYRRTSQIIAYSPADSVYADLDGDGVANLSIGRWPVRTLAELQAIVGKSLAYSNLRKALFVSDRALGEVSYATEVAPFGTLLGQGWSSDNLALDDYPAGQAAAARADILNQIANGTSLFTYYGHSAPASWSREGLMTANVVNAGLFSSVSHSFVVVQLGCWGTYFVEPTSSTVAHALLLQAHGAGAVLGSSTLTETSSDLAFANHLFPLLDARDLGGALQEAQQGVANEMPGAIDVILGGTLLGDPALR